MAGKVKKKSHKPYVKHWLLMKFDKLIRLSIITQIFWVLAVTFIFSLAVYGAWQIGLDYSEKQTDASANTPAVVSVYRVGGKPNDSIIIADTGQDAAQLGVIADTIPDTSLNIGALNVETKTKGAEDDMYDMFVHAVNPKFGYDLTFYQELLTILLYFVVGVGVTGIVFTSIVNLFDRRRQKWERGDLDYGIAGGFVLIIGGHSMVAQLCYNLINNKDNPLPPDNFILILTMKSVEVLRKEIQAKIGKEKMEQIVIYHGDRTEILDLERINPQFANNIYIIGEDDDIDGAEHDIYNLECLKKIDSLVLPTVGRQINCDVMFDYQTTSKIFQYTDISLPNGCIVFRPFNFYESWARRVLVKDIRIGANNPYNYLPLYGNERLCGASNDKYVHLIVVGMSNMGMALASQAALLCHFPNFVQNADIRPRTLITFIATDADVEMQLMMSRNPAMFELARSRFVQAVDPYHPQVLKHLYAPATADAVTANWYDPLSDASRPSAYAREDLGNCFIDIDWEFIKGEIQNPAIRRYLVDAALDNCCITTIAICQPMSQMSIGAALYLPQEVFTSSNVLQVLVYQKYSSSSIDTINNELTMVSKDGKVYSANTYGKLKPFGMLDDCDYFGDYDELTPKIISKFYSLVDGDLANTKLFDDFLAKLLDEYNNKYNEFCFEDVWQSITNDKGKSILAQRWSNIYHADSIDFKAYAFALQPDLKQLEPDDKLEIMAEVEHNRWCIEQLLTGYRPKLTSDALSKEELKLRKIHADIRSYDKLSAGTKLYDQALSQKVPVILYLRILLNKY